MKRMNKFYQTFRTTTKMMLLVVSCLMSSYALSAQTITATIIGGLCAGTYTFTLDMTQLNGRNQYSSQGSVAKLYWSGTQWEISITGQGVVFVNTTATLLPPCANIGAWIAGSTCVGGVITSSTGDCATIPVELVSFTVKNMGKTNQLAWKTATELNNKGFQVERSSNGKTWDGLSFVASKGNAGEYFFADDTPLSMSYYRLRQEDFDGQTKFSPIVAAHLNGLKNDITVSPNPNKGNLIHIGGLNNEKSDISITNTLGQSFYNQSFTSDNADISLSLPRGLYFVIVKTGNTVFTQKIIKE